MDNVNNKTAQSKGNIEIEGVKVPNTKSIEFLVKKYQDKLGEDAVNSLLFSLSQGYKIYDEEMKNGQCENTRSTK